MRKPRILFQTEATYLQSGYSVLGKELLSRLQNTGKYEIAELASFGNYPKHDSRAASIPWKYYPACPDWHDHQAVANHDKNKLNNFGARVFESACLDFHPDFVCSYGDVWNFTFMVHSPFRRHYNLVLMPTIDAIGHSDEWLSLYSNADAMLSYTDFSGKFLLDKCGSKVKYCGTASPGVNHEIFKKLGEKGEIKNSVGLSKESIIIGTVVRNQHRKLIPDTVDTFYKYLQTVDSDLASRSYLYLHTAYPDMGWRIPELLKRAGVSHKTIVTYYCRNCSSIFPAIFSDARMVCKHCKQFSATMASSNMGVPTEVMGMIYNLFDIYVQLAAASGIELPVLEAAACGVPFITLDYAGVSDPTEKLQGVGVPPLKTQLEADTEREMAVCDNVKVAEAIKWMAEGGEEMRAELGDKSAELCRIHYDWDKSVEKWMNIFDNLHPKNSWGEPARYVNNNYYKENGIPDNIKNGSIGDFVRWSIVNIGGRVDLVDSYLYLRFIRDLTWGVSLGQPGSYIWNEGSILSGRDLRLKDFTPDNVLNELSGMADNYNMWEQNRVMCK